MSVGRRSSPVPELVAVCDSTFELSDDLSAEEGKELEAVTRAAGAEEEGLGVARDKVDDKMVVDRVGVPAESSRRDAERSKVGQELGDEFLDVVQTRLGQVVNFCPRSVSDGRRDERLGFRVGLEVGPLATSVADLDLAFDVREAVETSKDRTRVSSQACQKCEGVRSRREK